jgi:hypothetical protein
MKKIAGNFLTIGLVITAAMGGVLAWMWKSLPPKIPLLYSLPWGEQQLAYKMGLVYILGGSLLLLLITRMFSKWAGRDDDTVEVTIMAGGLTATILLGATFFRIMQIFMGI